MTKHDKYAKQRQAALDKWYKDKIASIDASRELTLKRLERKFLAKLNKIEKQRLQKNKQEENKQRVKKWLKPKRVAIRKPKEKPITKLKKEAFAQFQKYIRLSKSDKNGICTCISCWKQSRRNRQMDWWHYIPASWSITDFDESNVRPQCVLCNRHPAPSNWFRWLSGNIIAYRSMLILKIGEKHVAALESKRSVKQIQDAQFYQAIIDRYKQLNKELEKTKKQ